MKHIAHVNSSLVLGRPFCTRSRVRTSPRNTNGDELLPAFTDRFTAMDELDIQGIQYMTLESHATLGSHLWESMPDVKILADDRNSPPHYCVEISTGWSFGSKEKTGMLCGGLCDYYLNTSVYDAPFRLHRTRSYWVSIFLPAQIEIQPRYDAFPNPGNVASAVDDGFDQDRIGLMSICGVSFDISLVTDRIMGFKPRGAVNHKLPASSADAGALTSRKRFPK